MRWVKTPVELALFPSVLALPINERWTFICLFARARRAPTSLIGWLLDDRGRAPSIRTIGTWAGIPKSTAHAHVDDLQGRGLLQKDQGGKFLVPLVVTLERRFDRRHRSSDTQPAPVENPQLTLPGLSGPPDTLSRQWDTASLYEVQKLEDVRPVDVVEAVENPGFGPRWDLVPSSLDRSSDNAYLLARLAEQHDVWARALADHKDAANIGRLAVAHPAELYEALAQESLEPSARNPAAWLNATVRSRTEAREATA